MELDELIGKVHEAMEGRYSLSGSDLNEIHWALCEKQSDNSTNNEPQLLSLEDFDALYDKIFIALNKDDLTNVQIMEYWNKLPEDIKLDALKWGVSDTLIRDKIYVWLKENYC